MLLFSHLYFEIGLALPFPLVTLVALSHRFYGFIHLQHCAAKLLLPPFKLIAQLCFDLLLLLALRVCALLELSLSRLVTPPLLVQQAAQGFLGLDVLVQLALQPLALQTNKPNQAKERRQQWQRGFEEQATLRSLFEKSHFSRPQREERGDLASPSRTIGDDFPLFAYYYLDFKFMNTRLIVLA